MNRNLLLAIAVTCMASSCYKTGEIIYQRKCTVVSLNMQTDKLYNRNFYPAAPNSNMNALIGYTNTPAKRTTLITGDKVDADQAYHYVNEFYYDNNNNLSFTRWIYMGDDPNFPHNNALAGNFVFTYPTGTTNSLSNTIKVQRFGEANSPYPELSYPLDSPYTYSFNNEFQLTSITDYYNHTLQSFEYDNGGNCTRNIVYNADNTVQAIWEYLSYDNKINPCRTDRTLQLYYNIYSKNNPTSVRLTVYDDHGTVQTFTNTFTYSFNSDNYVTGLNDFTKPFALYICPIP